MTVTTQHSAFTAAGNLAPVPGSAQLPGQLDLISGAEAAR